MRAMIKAHERQGPRGAHHLMACMTPRPAATLILLREGMEVLMLQRTQNAAFLGGAYVFPGGSLDPQDADMRRVVGLTEAQANERLQLASGAIAYYVAAIRECFEEAGILLAHDKDGRRISAARAESLTQAQKPAVPRNARSRGSLHPRRRARLLRPLDHRARPLAALQRALLRRARARRPARLERRQRDGARRVDHAARGARARRARRDRAGRCNADRAQGPVALQRSARRVRIRARPARGGREPRLLGAGQGRPEDLPPRAIRSTSRSTGAIRRKPAQTSYDLTAGEPKRLDALGDAPDRAQSRRDDRARNQYVLP